MGVRPLLNNYLDLDCDFLMGIMIHLGRYLLLGIGNFGYLFIKLRGRRRQGLTFRATAGRIKYIRLE